MQAPLGHLWGHIATFFPQVIFSWFLKCVLLTFKRSWVIQLLVGGMRAAPSGVLVKQHFGSITNGFASVKPHSVNLHPGDPPLSLVTKVTGAFAEARISKKTMHSQLCGFKCLLTVVWLYRASPHAGVSFVGEQRGGFCAQARCLRALPLQTLTPTVQV